MNFRLPNHPQRGRLGTANVHDQTHDQVRKIEAEVESVSERVTVMVGVLAVSEGFVRAREHRFEIAQDGVDPLELRQITRLALADDFDAVRAAALGHRPETCQTVAEYSGTRSQIGSRPLRDRVVGEAWNLRDLYIQRVALVVERDGVGDGNLVLRSAAGFAAGALATEIGVVDLHRANQAVRRLAVGHRLHDFVVHQPGCRVAHADPAL